jgi:outer membrane protein assembly factor BamB
MRVASSTCLHRSVLGLFVVATSLGLGCGSSASDDPSPLDLDGGVASDPTRDGGGGDDSGPGSDSGKTPPPPPTEATSVHAFGETTALRPHGMIPLGPDLLITGADNFQAPGGDRHAVAMRADLKGNVKWAKRFAGGFDDQFFAQALVGTTLHALGITRSVFTGIQRNADVLWTQLNVDTGALLVSRHFGTPIDEDLTDAVAVAGGLVIVGTTNGGADAYVARLDTATATVAWARRWSTPGTDVFRAVRSVPDGILALGYSSVALGGKVDPIVVKFDNLGNHLWSSRISGGAEDDLVFSARVVSDGIVLVGQTTPAPAAPSAALALEVSLDGASVLWAKSYATTTASSWRGSALVASDAVYDLPESLIVSGTHGSAVTAARIATKTGLLAGALDLTEPSEAAVASEGENVWQRPALGLGILYHATPKGSTISSLGMALPNRLLELSATCSGATKPVHVVTDLALTVVALTPTVGAFVMPVAAGLPVSDLTLAKTSTCN